MKRHLNTLFITTEGTYLAKERQAVLVRLKKQTLLRVPLHNLDGIVCFGRIGFSPSLAGVCAANGVTISLLNVYGRFQAAVVGFTPGNVLLRREQYRTADDPAHSAAFAKNIVAGKIANCRSVFLRGARDAKDTTTADTLRTVARRMTPALESVRKETDLDKIRGYEGEAARRYFANLGKLVSDQQPEFQLSGRNRRPPLDRMNALLSFLYAMLSHDARSACEATGLDAAVGFLHRDRPGRPGLALDLMEEFRPFLVDRLALSLVNRRQIAAKGFHVTESGAVTMTDDTRKAVLVAYQKRKQDVIEHPFLQEKTTVGLLIHLQARLMARHLRGDLDEYPPFMWK